VSQKKRGVELFAITLSTVNRFWKFFHLWKSNKLSMRKGKKYYTFFLDNLLLFVTVKEFWKSVNSWCSYRKKFDAAFFLRHSIYKCNHYWATMEELWKYICEKQCSTCEFGILTSHTLPSIRCCCDSAFSCDSYSANRTKPKPLDCFVLMSLLICIAQMYRTIKINWFQQELLVTDAEQSLYNWTMQFLWPRR